MSEWVSVEERLPIAATTENWATGDPEILVWCDSKREVFKGFRIEHDDGLTIWCIYPGSATEAEVTHWMPLPAPPK